jgi:hypothetical protein
MSTGTEIGIALGTVGGIASFAIIFGLIYFCLRRRRRAQAQEIPRTSPMNTDVREPTLPQIEKRASEAEMRSPAWSGHKSELPADESITSPSPRLYRASVQSAEMEGSSARMSPIRPMQDGSLRVPGQERPYYEMSG